MSTTSFQSVSNSVYAMKYQLKDKHGNLVDADRQATFKRVAKALAVNEKKPDWWEGEFLWAMDHGAVPAGRILSNAGAGEHKPHTTLINCVLSRVVTDSIQGIGQAVMDAGITLSTGAGIGYEFSTLRPRGAYVNGVGSETSGPLPFMDVFDKMCSTVASAGGRRGAQMATFDLRHPDVLDFVKAKQENGRFRQFNMSVLIPDSFMEDVLALDHHEQVEPWKLIFPLRKTDPQYGSDELQTVEDWWHVSDYAYIKTSEGKTVFKVYGTIDQNFLWKTIMESSYNFAEPGVMFIDKINKENNLWFAEHLSSSNPCSEIFLPPNGSCLLGSINLTKLVREPFTSEAHFDMTTFKKVVSIFTRMLDNVVELSELPLQGQRDEIFRKRRHGMGIMGLGTVLNMMGIKYGSKQAISFVSNLMQKLAFEGYKTGIELAREKGAAQIMNEVFKITPELCRYGNEYALENVGKSFRGIELWLQSGYMQRLLKTFPGLREGFLNHGCRFTHHSAIAPTGTISLAMCDNISNGIEPSFAHVYTRNLTISGKKTRQQEKVYSYEALAFMEFMGKESEEPELPNTFVTADSLHWKEHVDMLAAAQEWVDAGISKTVNLPTEISFAEFKDVYLHAYLQGCKSVAVFRYNPDTLGSILTLDEDLKKTRYKFTLESGEVLEVTGDQMLDYDGETTSAANLFSALKEGTYAKF